MSTLQAKSRKVHPPKTTPRRRFAEGLIEPGPDVPAVRRLKNGLGCSNAERLVVAFAWKAALLTVPPRTSLEDAEDTAAVAALKALADFRARFAKDGEGWLRSRPPVEDEPLPRPRYFHPTPEQWEEACAVLRGDVSNSHWDEYQEWADNLENPMGWADREYDQTPDCEPQELAELRMA